MASLLLNAAPVDYQDNININNNQQNNFSKKQSKNKTIKNENNRKIKAEMLKKSFEFNDDDDNDSDDLENFKPVQRDNIKLDNNLLKSLNINNEQNSQNSENIEKLENQQNIASNTEPYMSDYYKNYLEKIKGNNNLEIISNNELLKKLDNILYILEEQDEEKNSYITEELILYLFFRFICKSWKIY